MPIAMNTQKPQLSDFGIRPEEYALYRKDIEGFSWRVYIFPVQLFLCLFVVVYVGLLSKWDPEMGLSNFLTIFYGSIMVSSLLPGLIVIVGVFGEIGNAITRFKKTRLMGSPVGTRLKLFEYALSAYREAEEEAAREARRARQEAERTRLAQAEIERARRRTLIECWMSLGGLEFELEMANLYARLGYRVESTPTSGDQGIDLVLRKDGKTTVVQCKSHKAPVGPAVTRELFGSMVASGANNAILACTGGFTRGAIEFAQGIPITLVSAEDIVTMGGNVEGKTMDGRNSPPICPTPGCAKAMVLRQGRRGLFWGCPAFPRCRGTRRAS